MDRKQRNKKKIEKQILLKHKMFYNKSFVLLFIFKLRLLNSLKFVRKRKKWFERT